MKYASFPHTNKEWTPHMQYRGMLCHHEGLVDQIRSDQVAIFVIVLPSWSGAVSLIELNLCYQKISRSNTCQRRKWSATNKSKFLVLLPSLLLFVLFTCLQHICLLPMAEDPRINHDAIVTAESGLSTTSEHRENDVMASLGYKQACHLHICHPCNNQNWLDHIHIRIQQEMNKSMSTISNFAVAFGCCSILSGLTPVNIQNDQTTSRHSAAIISTHLWHNLYSSGVMPWHQVDLLLSLKASFW